mmetsp:Transcript_67919/g.99357  ORF Transcript_67919/g.99357 Transcript_67919/m.99357 type:complete len:162 (-) Transcript_67919:188-673(-)
MAVAKAVDSATGEIVGAVELIMLPYPASPSPQRPYLFNLCVHPDFRSRGLGRRLVEWCEEISKEWGFEELFLHVEQDDIRRLYTSYGYTATFQKPTWVDLNLRNIVVLPIATRDASDLIGTLVDTPQTLLATRALEGDKGWIIMHRKFEADAVAISSTIVS